MVRGKTKDPAPTPGPGKGQNGKNRSFEPKHIWFHADADSCGEGCVHEFIMIIPFSFFFLFFFAVKFRDLSKRLPLLRTNQQKGHKLAGSFSLPESHFGMSSMSSGSSTYSARMPEHTQLKGSREEGL